MSHPHITSGMWTEQELGPLKSVGLRAIEKGKRAASEQALPASAEGLSGVSGGRSGRFFCGKLTAWVCSSSMLQ